jgi:hypothetical protein
MLEGHTVIHMANSYGSRKVAPLVRHAIKHDAVDKAIGRRVMVLMNSAGMLQEQLGIHLGLTQASVSRKLHGERPWYPGELIYVAQLFRVSVGSLYGEEPMKMPRTYYKRSGHLK